MILHYVMFSFYFHTYLFYLPRLACGPEGVRYPGSGPTGVTSGARGVANGRAGVPGTGKAAGNGVAQRGTKACREE